MTAEDDAMGNDAAGRSGSLVRLVPDSVHDVIAENSGLLLLSFSLPLHNFCEFFRGELANLAPSFHGAIAFADVELTVRSGLLKDFAVKTIPTLLLYKGPDEVERVERAFAPDVLGDYLQTAVAFYN